MPSSAPPRRPLCSCGFDKFHPQVAPKYKYSLWGWLLLLTGISAKPREVAYRCRRCGTVVEKDANPGI